MRRTGMKERFIASGGSPLIINGRVVIQMDTIPVTKAKLNVSASKARNDQGIALKSPKGSITLSDGRKVPLLHMWFDEGLPLSVAHDVDCGSEGLRIWNIYRTRHAGGVVTEDAWTGNAGMAVLDEGENYRRYGCSPGNADHFDPQLDVVITWQESA
jgi:hypothetical protein